VQQGGGTARWHGKEEWEVNSLKSARHTVPCRGAQGWTARCVCVRARVRACACVDSVGAGTGRGGCRANSGKEVGGGRSWVCQCRLVVPPTWGSGRGCIQGEEAGWEGGWMRPCLPPTTPPQSWGCFLVRWDLFGPFVLCACVPASAFDSWLPSVPPFLAGSDSIRPVRFVDPSRGGPEAPPIALARVMLPSHQSFTAWCPNHVFLRRSQSREG
jgi:hypothetical protein